MSDNEILRGLHGCSEANEVWVAHGALLERMEAQEVQAVCGATLTAEQRAFNAGRLAFCKDVQVLREKFRVKANAA